MLSVHVQRCPAGYQYFKIGTTRQEIGHGRRRLNQVLEIVQQEQHGGARCVLLVSLEYFERRLTSCLPDSQRLDEHRRDQGRNSYGGKRNEIAAAWKALAKAARHLHR